MVTTCRNTVYSVFFLILDFISISILFIMIGAEFLGMIMLIVYVGAVAVLFLFVVMMLNVADKNKTNPKRKGIFNNLSVSAIIGFIIFVELIIVIGGWEYKSDFIFLTSTNIINVPTNTHALGNVLYTDYIHLFQLSGIILLIAMIGAISLTFTKRENVKRQNYFDQIKRERSEGVEVLDIASNKGVKIDD